MLLFIYFFPAEAWKEIKALGTVCICCNIKIINIALLRGQTQHSQGAKRRKEHLACFPVHLLSLQTVFHYWDNRKEMVSRPTYKQRWPTVIEASSTQKRYSNYNQCTVPGVTPSPHSYFIVLFMEQRAASLASSPLTLHFCFYFPLGQHELMWQTKKRTICTGFVFNLHQGQSQLMFPLSIPTLWAMAHVLHSLASGVIACGE